MKSVNAKITKSKIHYYRVSLRDPNGEDIRIALTNAGFESGDEVVIIPRSSVEKILSLLKGIDETEPTNAAWWETSTGAEFGAGVLKEIRGLLGVSDVN